MGIVAMFILHEKQKVEINDTKDIDVFGYYLDKSYLSIQVFFIRGGKILERHSKIYPIIDDVTDELNRYIAKFYEKDIIPPKEILVPSIVDPSIIEKVTNIKVVVPSKGTKKNLVDMACNNANIRLNEKFELIKKDEQRTTIANEELKNILKLDKLDRIEIFDNAHLFLS